LKPITWDLKGKLALSIFLALKNTYFMVLYAT